MTSAANRESAGFLADAHSVLAEVVGTYGPPKLPARRPPDGHFGALCESVAYQQLAGAAAEKIHGRFVLACDGDVSAARVASLSFDTLRSVGLSGSKVGTIQGIAGAVLDGSLPLDSIARKSDEEISRMLCELRGIGPWTAEMFLMFQLGRRDVWPVGDYAVRVGWTNLFGLPELIAPKALREAGAPYSPHRSALAWYCWQSVDTAGRA
ncbi:MAG: hypothetical protein WBD02_02720 [Acidimicrobiia bacterium]